ncbi:MAG: class I SAM-dependent methyltransferase [Patescibacteria group bacterium]
MKQDNIKKEFIDRQVLTFSETGEHEELLNRHKKILSLILKYSSKNDYVLDIGCFDGKILKSLEQEGYNNLYGVDFSEAAKVSFTKSSIHFAPCDIEHQEISFKEKFDVVILSDVLEHLFSPQSILFDLKKKLSKDARIVLSVPNAGWFINGLLLSFFPSKLFLSTAFGPWGHTYHFTFYNVKKTAQNLKFKVLELSGGRMDNYVFNSGIKKMLFEGFLQATYSLALIWPKIFSAHIFGVFQNTNMKLTEKERFELGD